MSDIMNELKGMDKQFENAEAQGGYQADLPPGDYVAELTEAEIFRSKSERLFLKMKFKVAEGDMTGAMFTKLHSLDAPERFGFLKTDLLVCGVAIAKLSELPDRLKFMKDIKLKVGVVKNGQYTNYYLNGRVNTNTDTDDQVPF
jgi:hypothetical protein